MDTIEKVYCTGHDNNDALVAALASKNNCVIQWLWQL